MSIACYVAAAALFAGALLSHRDGIGFLVMGWIMWLIGLAAGR